MKAGQKYIVSVGCYSSYEFIDSFVAVTNFSLDKELAAWLSEHGRVDGTFGMGDLDDAGAFLASLRARNLVVDVPANEVHLYDYNWRANPNPAGDAKDG